MVLSINQTILIILNNIQPGHSDSFQTLLAHEFAHASIDLGHNNKIKEVERIVAQQA